MSNDSILGSLADLHQQTQPLDSVGMMQEFVRIYNEYTSKLAVIQEQALPSDLDALMQIIHQQKEEINALRQRVDTLSACVKYLTSANPATKEDLDAVNQTISKMPDCFGEFATKADLLQLQNAIISELENISRSVRIGNVLSNRQPEKPPRSMPMPQVAFRTAETPPSIDQTLEERFPNTDAVFPLNSSSNGWD